MKLVMIDHVLPRNKNKTFSAWTIPGLRLRIIMIYVVLSVLYESLDYAQSEKNTPVHVYAHVGHIKAQGFFFMPGM